jgi:glutamate 5-kinase
MMDITNSKRLIVKIGSRLLINEAKQQFNTPWLTSLIDDMAQLIRQGIQLIVVTSGSVACGNIVLNQKRAQLTLDKQQAAAAVGQIQIIHTYQTLFAQQDIKSAQILLTMEDIETRRRYVNLRNTIESLLKLNVVPIINENDSIATSEIRYGDNDRLASRVAQMVEADTLILLSDIDGLYTADPHRDSSAQFIEEVRHITPEIKAMAHESSTQYGSGGMRTKIQAASIAVNSGCRLLITKGKMHHPLQHYQKMNKGTWFLANKSSFNAKKSWLKEHLKPCGNVVVDNGAIIALNKGKSLLPVGIVRIEGRFDKGDPVSIVNQENEVLARGLTNYSDVELGKIMGQSTDLIEKCLHYRGTDEVIHRNNLVMLGEEDDT